MGNEGNKVYYTGTTGIEVWDIIETFELGPHRSWALKYILRAGVKTADPIEDLSKAIACIHREIESVN